MRRNKATIREIQPDYKYSSVIVAKMINYFMKDGDKNGARKTVYGALEIIKEKMNSDPMVVLDQFLEKNLIRLEVRSKRVGGSTYQVPRETAKTRALALAMRKLKEFSNSRKARTNTRIVLAQNIMDGANGKGPCAKFVGDIMKTVDANKVHAYMGSR